MSSLTRMAQAHSTIRQWNEVFVFFKHEDEGTGPKLAAEFIKLAMKL